MATEKKRVSGELTAWLIRWVREAVWADRLPGLDQLNPYREEKSKSDELERIEEWQANRRWSAMFGSKQE